MATAVYVIFAWSELLQPPVPRVCPYTQRSPWAAVCLFSKGLVASAMWLWLTVGLTTPFMRHLLAVNQGDHPGAIDGAVSLCEMCLSKPTHSAALSPCLGSLAFVYCPPSTFPSFPSLVSFFHCLLSPSPAGFPLETREPLNPWSNQRFFGYTFVILRPSGLTNTSAGDSDLIYMCFYCCSLYLRVPSMLPSPILCPHISASVSFLILLILLFSSLTLHLSTWQVTRAGPPADWLIGGLSSLSIFFPSQTKPDQAGPEHLVSWPRAQSFVASGGNAPKTLQQPSGYGSSPRPHPVKSPN